MREPKILCVDDDADLLNLLLTTFAHEGFDVKGADGGAEAIRLIDTEHPDVVVLDLMMPIVDGFTVLRRLRHRVRRPRVLCLTAKDGRMDRGMAWRLGIDEYITKPFDTQQLVDAVSSVLGRTPVQRTARMLRAVGEFYGG
jgi:DNA-binding response OmpR family regulator